MAHEKQYTAKQAASAVLDKVGEILKKSAVLKDLKKAEGYASQNPKKENAKPSEHNSKDAYQAANGPGPKGEIHPKEHVEGAAAPASEGIKHQVDPQHNSAEQKEGNNELAGTTPTQVGQDGKNKPGYDEMKGHLKLAKFIGMKHYKRGKALESSQSQSGAAAQHAESIKK